MRMKVHHNGGATGQHSGHQGSHTHGKSKHGKHKKGHSTSKLDARQIMANGGQPLSKQDSEFGKLVEAVSGALLNQGFAGLLVQAMERMMTAAQGENPGKLIAGTVSGAAGAISSGGGDVTTAMVYLNGSTVPTPVYVPPHLVADLTAGCEVWVRAANGNRADLMIDSVRAFTSTPSSSTYETSAHAAATYATIVNVDGGVLHFLGSPVQLASSVALAANTDSAAYQITGANGVPSDATAVLVWANVTSASTGANLVLKPFTATGLQHYGILGDLQVASKFTDGQLIVPVDVNGRIGAYNNSGASITYNIWIVGYFN